MDRRRASHLDRLGAQPHRAGLEVEVQPYRVAVQPVRVSPFVIRNGKLERLATVPARVVYRSEQEDIALLQIDATPDTLQPLYVAAKNPESGRRVFAIGHPRIGDQVLEQTISEGIISAAERIVDGQTYLQHTAAVNPGCSGGPLLDERGHVVGLITLRATLENVSFAIPPDRIRRILSSQPRP